MGDVRKTVRFSGLQGLPQKRGRLKWRLQRRLSASRWHGRPNTRLPETFQMDETGPAVARTSLPMRYPAVCTTGSGKKKERLSKSAARVATHRNAIDRAALKASKRLLASYGGISARKWGISKVFPKRPQRAGFPPTPLETLENKFASNFTCLTLTLYIDWRGRRETLAAHQGPTQPVKFRLFRGRKGKDLGGCWLRGSIIRPG